MRTPVVNRRTAQVETIPEIEETVQQECAPPLPAEKIYVAVGKDLSESASALKWKLQNLDKREETLIILLHIRLALRYFPSPMGKIPLNQVSKDVLKAYKKDEEKELDSCMNKYLDMCTRAKVKAECLIIEKEEVSKGIVEVVSERGITKLVMGTSSAGGAISKKMKMQQSGKAYYVQRHAGESCDVSVVCKGKLVLFSEGSPGQYTFIFASRKSKSSRSPLPDWLWKRNEASIDKPSPNDFSRSASSPANFGSDLNNSNQTPPNFQRDAMAAETEKVDDLEITALIDEVCSELEAADRLRIDVDQIYDVEHEPAESRQEANTDAEVLKLQLTKALEAVENANKELQSESVRRKKAEAAAIISIRKYQNLEAAYKDIAKEKDEAVSRLKLYEQKCQDLTRRRIEVEEEVQKMVEKMTSLRADVDEYSRERQEAMQEVESTRQKLADVEEQNNRILQQRDAEILHLQNCLIRMPPVESPISSSSSNNLEFREYSFDDIKAATCNFSANFKLGEGGYGDVYRGKIKQTAVAVKILRENGLQGRQEFQSEIDIFKDIQHPHLVRIVGACSERGCIIYEYMSNGCLEDHLSCKGSSPPLPWYARFRIADEVCSALQYLHSFMPDPIVHRDLKPQNILLDENYVSKISDFGLSRLLSKDLHSESEPKGTFSYMDPEYLTNGEYTTKSDVYSLGIVILQLLTGKPALGIVKEVERALQSSNFDKILDPSAGDWPFVHANQLAYLALHCTHPERNKRPDLQPTVMKMLNQLRNMFPETNLGRPVESGQKSGKATEEIHVPSFFLCPVFKEIMHDPYVAADGFTYEKEAIQGWFDCGRDTSPMTNEKLGSKNLIANFSLRSAIRHWQERDKFRKHSRMLEEWVNKMKSEASDFIKKPKDVHTKLDVQELEIAIELKNAKEQEISWQDTLKEFQRIAKTNMDVLISEKVFSRKEEN
ncbi:U-box domain-containing protein 33 [Cryptomeria japonica]|uniref:U-box domain-containing protein 33 n=1 Tax=Cryptomeria japonica TaxID=3369 RepID=UPI0027DA6F5C|nr:U-box domain-containing protein 33 [Cryptomeria japonica]